MLPLAGLTKQYPVDQLIENLRAVVGRDQILTEPDELLVYECDGLPQHKFPPRAVVFPHSTEEVAEIMRVMARAGVPFAPRGAGTGLSGGALALDRGVVIELARMRRVLKIDVDNRLAVVETGMVNLQLSRAAAPHGLYYVPDPSSQGSCTIGGNIAENAGGIHCLKYGTTVDHVMAARVVLAEGRIVDLGGVVEAPGYDLLGVFVGSEGTFGIATEATVRLVPIPPAVRTLLADFADVDDASRAVSAIIAAGLMPAALEMMDGAIIRAVEASVFAAGLPPDAGAALLIELDGLEAGLDEEAERAASICLRHGARRCRQADDEHERKKLWAARKGAFGAMGRVSPDLMIQDAVVPRSRLPEVLAGTYRIAAKYDLRIANVFHAGDGNLHPLVSFDARYTDVVKRVQEAGREIMETCVRAGGSITGEHGVGLDKRSYLPLIFSETDMEAMLRVRAAFDPLGLCNPGKIVPTPRGCGEARAVAETPGRAEDAAIKSESPRLPITTPPRREFGAPSKTSFGVDAIQGALARIVGEAHIGSGSTAPESVTVAPASAEEACEVLRLASKEGWTVVPAGAGTWLDAGNPVRRTNVIVQTGRIARVIEHEPADLVATAEAGVTLSALNTELGRAGQWLPLDPPDDGRATVGGVAATGLSGAQRLGYGAPRGFVIGMRVALADGRIVRAGGRVVKNVAGYDLCKLFVGSYGTLGLILELTFKLRPRPASLATVIMRATDYGPLLKAGRAVTTARLLPVAVELLSPRMAASVGVSGDEKDFVLLTRFAGTAEAVSFQVARAREMFNEYTEIGPVETVADDALLWRGLTAMPLKGRARLVWRSGVPSTKLGALLAELHGHLSDREGSSAWHAGVGDGRLRVIEEAGTSGAECVSELERLRAIARAADGVLVVESAPPEIKRSFDAWGVGDQSAVLMQRLKEQLDPADLLCPGRFASMN